MKIIYAINGEEIHVDDWWYDELNAYRWRIKPDNTTSYAVTGKNNYMHRMITGYPDGMDVDHWDGNGLHNEESNLKVCPHKVNIHNLHPQKESLVKYKGVSESKRDHCLTTACKAKHIRNFPLGCEKAAARAYDRRALKVLRWPCYLNFPELRSQYEWEIEMGLDEL